MKTDRKVLTYTDEEILYAFKKGEEDRVLPFIYRTLFPKIKGYIIGNDGDEEEAADIFQDALMAFFKQVKSGKFNENYTVGGFIYTVSKNSWINRVKKRNRTTALPNYDTNIDDTANAEEVLLKEEKKALVRKVLEKTDEGCRQLLLYIFYYELKPKEIMKKMGFANENSVKSVKYRCKKKLLELIEKYPQIERLLKP